MVSETYDLLRSERVPHDLSIAGDTIVEIEHSLFVSGSEAYTTFRDEEHTPPITKQPSIPVTTTTVEEDVLKNINVVYSHEQALGQCAGWLNRNLPDAKRVPVSSTAAAAKMLFQPPICQSNTPLSPDKVPKTEYMRAAIASEICLRLYPELRLVQKGIQDNKGTFLGHNNIKSYHFWLGNQTRFILISKSSSPTLAMPPLRSKSILRIPVTHSTSSSHTLYRILQTVTSVTDPPLIRRIERRPSIYGDAWDDIYFVDLEEHPDNRLEPVQTREGSRWESTIQHLCGRIRETGGIVDILGIW